MTRVVLIAFSFCLIQLPAQEYFFEFIPGWKAYYAEVSMNGYYVLGSNYDDVFENHVQTTDLDFLGSILSESEFDFPEDSIKNLQFTRFNSFLSEEQKNFSVGSIRVTSTQEFKGILVKWNSDFTDALLTEVILTQYGDALELYYELSSKSPYLSLDVMIETIQKEAELPPLLLTLILESNPHAAKSGMVQQRLDQRSIPLEEYQRAMIDQGLYVISSKEALESRLSSYENDQHAFLNGAIIKLMKDTTIMDKLSEIGSLVDSTGRETLDLRYLRIDLLIEEGSLIEAQDLLNETDNDFNKDTRQQGEFEDFQYCYSLLISKMTNDEDSLSGMEESTLIEMAAARNTRASGMAQVLLSDYAGMQFDEVLVEPGAIPKSISRKYGMKPVAYLDSDIELYPNPASEFMVLKWAVEKGAHYRVFDESGKEVLSETLEREGGFNVIDVSELSSGTYSLSIKGVSKLFQVVR